VKKTIRDMVDALLADKIKHRDFCIEASGQDYRNIVTKKAR